MPPRSGLLATGTGGGAGGGGGGGGGGGAEDMVSCTNHHMTCSCTPVPSETEWVREGLSITDYFQTAVMKMHNFKCCIVFCTPVY